MGAALTFDFRGEGRFPATELPVSADFGGDTAFFGGLRDVADILVFGCRLEVSVWMFRRPLLDALILDFVLAGKFCRLLPETGGFAGGFAALSGRRVFSRVFKGGAVFFFTGALGTLALKVFGLPAVGDTLVLCVVEVRADDTLAIIKRRWLMRMVTATAITSKI